MQRGRGRGGRGRGRGDDSGRGRTRGERGPGRQTGWMTQAQALQSAKSALAGKRILASTVKKFENFAEGEFAPRPDNGGTAGRQIKIRTNCYRLECRTPSIYHYDVAITQHGRALLSGEKPEATEDVDRLPAKLSRAILSDCATRHSWPSIWAFDGRKNLYSPEKMFQSSPVSFVVDMSARGRERKFNVKISLAATLNLSDVRRFLQQGNVRAPHNTVAALEICLKTTFVNDPRCICFARSFFYADQRTKQDLPGGTELMQGHIQSVKLTESGLVLNLDLKYNAFLKEQPLLDFILSLTFKRNVHEMKNFSERDWRRIKSELKGIDVTTIHLQGNNKRHRSGGLTRQPAAAMRFQLKNGDQKTVASYWAEKYGALRYPWLPCLDVSKGKKLNYIPLEVCRILPHQRRGNLTADQTRELIKTSASRPHDRLQGIRDIVRKSHLRQENVAGFKISVDGNEMEVEARVLPQPYLEYAVPSGFDAGNRGQWNLNGVKLYRGAKLASWSVVSFARNTPDLITGANGLQNFITGLADMMQRMGLTVANEMPPFNDAGRVAPREALVTAIKNAQATFKAPPELIMVLLPNKDANTYKEIKAIAEADLGVMTQCFVVTSAGIGRPPRGQEQYMANIIQKINVKLGGKNVRVAGSLSQLFPALGCKQNRPFIVFGADVTHPTTHDRSVPSVGGIVASMDSDLSLFCGRPVILPHRQETLEMKDAIAELLQCFKQKTNVVPEAVFFYRDGVSDGQFESVLQHEREEFCKAFKKLSPDYNPPLTYIVVKKRHHVRFFPPENVADRNGNPLPGTVVDRHITSSRDFDFYLNSHAGIQGTNKPAHYYVLLDENGFGSDGLQIFTHWMCHLFARCTRSVSYAPPAYYAHLAALHGRYLSRAESDTSSIEGTGPQETKQLHHALRGRMYFA